MEEDSENVPTPGQVSGIIPHFYYDVIGRILPGTFFIVGLAVLYLPRDKVSELGCRFAPPVSEHSGAYLIFVVTLLLFSLVLLGYIVGSLLGSVSYYPFEKYRGFRRAIGLADLNRTTVFRSLRGDKHNNESPHPGETELIKRFEHHFGTKFGVDPAESLSECSRLCTYFVWARNVSLGQMTARWDAECLASRNILFGASVLCLLRGFQMACNLDSHWPFLVTTMLILIAAFAHYEYLRRIQLSGRFSLFWAIGGIPQQSAQTMPGSSQKAP
jgi:hypothetical protein